MATYGSVWVAFKAKWKSNTDLLTKMYELESKSNLCYKQKWEELCRWAFTYKDHLIYLNLLSKERTLHWKLRNQNQKVRKWKRSTKWQKFNELKYET